MTGSRRFITLNRASEWRRGLLSGLKISGNSIVPENENVTSAVFISGSVDSSEHDFFWRSFLVEAALPENMIMRVSAYSANTTRAETDGSPVELDGYLRSGAASPEEKLRRLERLFRPICSGRTEGPLNLRGRYIWIKLDFVMLDRRALRLDKIRLLLKSESMMDYLPEVYRTADGENGFLTRFLSIFDSIFFDMDDRIGALSDSLDYRAAEGDLLRYLAEWVNVEDTAYLSDEALRRRIGRAVSERGLTGTVNGLIGWIKDEYGVNPNIIEHYSVRKMVREGKDKDVYRRLFGDDPHKFFILLPENVFADTHEANIFMDKLKRRIPANTVAEVVTLQKSVILGRHTYLGVNSVLGGYSEARADSSGRMSHHLILGGEDNEQR